MRDGFKLKTSTVEQDEGGQCTGLLLEGDIIIRELLAPFSIILRVDDGAGHASSVLRNPKVANSTIVGTFDALRRCNSQAVLLHNKSRMD